MVDILNEEFIIPSYQGDLIEIIEYYYENRLDKKDPNYKKWKKQMNLIIDTYNKLVKFQSIKNIT